MALPTSGPLSINDIRAELGASTTNQSLGAFSDTAGFAAPDAISDFYGYSNVTLTAYDGSAFQNGVKFICDQPLNVTYYHDGSGTLPVVGDTIYTNSGGTTIIGGGQIGYNKTSGFLFVRNTSAGVVDQVNFC